MSNIVLKNGVGEIVEKKSRFIAHIYKIENEEQAVSYINEIKKQYWDARHNCFAYVCGDNNELQRFSDDGEPQGTAGKPLLDILIKGEITNCLVIVTRYFGGILLGTGGLVRAYQAAAREGIKESDIAELTEGVYIVMRPDYTMFGKIQYICGELGINIVDIQYEDKVLVKMVMNKEVLGKFEKRVQDLYSGADAFEENKKQNYCLGKDGTVYLM